MPDQSAHWNAVYESKAPTSVSWYQAYPKASLKAIDLIGAQDQPFLDVGGGASDLAAVLLERGWRDLTVLDISNAALAVQAQRLGDRAQEVVRIAANITEWVPPRAYGIWHDRAVFHFLTNAADRAAYVAALRVGVRPDGHVILATFAPDGPETCSGLPVRRYSAEGLAQELGDAFTLLHHWREVHQTPGGAEQPFAWAVFQRR